MPHRLRCRSESRSWRSQKLAYLRCYPLPVQFENYVYPQYGVPLVEAYGSAFESVFIVLHPFIRVAESLGWTATHQYPEDRVILSYGSRYPWTEVCARTGLSSCARLNQALLTSIGSLKGELADPASQAVLQTFLQREPIWMPTEGRFEPLLQEQFLATFEACAAGELVFVPEFPDVNPVVRLSIAGLTDGSIPFPGRGTLLATDESFLFTVDWDSFFTLFYGPRTLVSRVAAELRLEGFFATPNTDHAWFNYSMGCATVTLSPEYWQSV
jgi:hypothetical protein